MRIRPIFFAIGVGIAMMLGAANAWAKSAPDTCRSDIVATDGYKVRSVRFLARFAPMDLLNPQVPKPGTPYSGEVATKLVEALHEAMQHEAVNDSEEGGTEIQLLDAVSAGKGTKVGVNFVTSCTRVVPEAQCEATLGAGSAKCVDIDVTAYAVRIDTSDMWSNLLENARANAPTFLSNVPGPLRALNPRAGIGYDRSYGTAGTVGFASNLLDLPKNLQRKALTPSATRLDAGAQVRKSFQDSFYNASASLALSHHFAKGFDSIAARTNLASDHTPLGSGDYRRNSASGGIDVRLHTRVHAFSAVTAGAAFVRSGNALNDASTSTATGSDENSFAARVISDGQWLGGFSRLGIWADGASPNSLPGSYHRFAVLLGYARDFSIRPHQAISVEVLSGGGEIWGSAPAYDRLFGGSAAKSFLYEASDSGVLTMMPSGPLLRSLGSTQGGAGSTSALSGGTSYWHANVNVAFPVPKWSRPLIPDITIDGIPKADANCKAVFDENHDPIIDDRPLGEILKSQGGCAKNTLALSYKAQGFSKADAEAKAEKDLAGVNSILEFLADRANLISVKPLLMFDAARIYGSGPSGDHTRYGVGGGIQVTVVIARLEAGYMAGIRRFPSDPPGSFVVRLVFQNLF